jgi:ribosome-binding factor A
MAKRIQTGQGPTQRQLRVGEQVRHEIAQTLQRGHFGNPDLSDNSRMITVTEVRLSPDLKNAKAYVLPLGGKKEDVERLLPLLNDEHRVFQADLAHALEMKFTPRVKFIEDTSFGEAQRIESILHNIHKAHPNAYKDEEEEE